MVFITELQFRVEEVPAASRVRPLRGRLLADSTGMQRLASEALYTSRSCQASLGDQVVIKRRNGSRKKTVSVPACLRTQCPVTFARGQHCEVSVSWVKGVFNDALGFP